MKWSLPHFADPDIDCSCGYVFNEAGDTICEVYYTSEKTDRNQSYPTQEEAIKNARLISIAPEMSEEIETLQKLIKNMIKAYHRHDDSLHYAISEAKNYMEGH